MSYTLDSQKRKLRKLMVGYLEETGGYPGHDSWNQFRKRVGLKPLSFTHYCISSQAVFTYFNPPKRTADSINTKSNEDQILKNDLIKRNIDLRDRVLDLALFRVSKNHMRPIIRYERFYYKQLKDHAENLHDDIEEILARFKFSSLLERNTSVELEEQIMELAGSVEDDFGFHKEDVCHAIINLTAEKIRKAEVLFNGIRINQIFLNLELEK